MFSIWKFHLRLSWSDLGSGFQYQESDMNQEYFLAQDQAGNTQTVHVTRHAQNGQASDVGDAGGAASTPRATYALSDGSPVKRIDSDTFQVLGTGAFVTVIRE
jgi:hypothetical protein